MKTCLGVRLLSVALTTLSFIAASAQVAYFPNKAFDDNPKSNQFVADWYGGQLKALHESSLFHASQTASTQAYRFLWLRTFHHPVAIRLDIDSVGLGRLTTKMTDGAGGYKPGKLIKNETRPLTQEQTAEFLTQLKAADFWSLPAKPKEPMGCDGSEWVVEGVKDGKYHLATRWTPEKGPIHDLGMLAIRLSNLTIPQNEIY